MINVLLIPLIGSPESFQIGLLGVNYLMTIKWNNASDGGWEFDLSLSDTGESLVAGSPIITGADCLAGLEYLGIGGSLLVYTDGEPTAVPSFTNLGTESNLYFTSPA